MDQRNFLDSDYRVFSDEVRHASVRAIPAYPFVTLLERTKKIAEGLEQIFKIAQTNEVQKEYARDCDPDEPIEPPLSDRTVMGLLSLGETASQMLVDEVACLAKWANERALEKEGTPQSSPAADLAIAAQAAAALKQNGAKKEVPVETV